MIDPSDITNYNRITSQMSYWAEYAVYVSRSKVLTDHNGKALVLSSGSEKIVKILDDGNIDTCEPLWAYEDTIISIDVSKSLFSDDKPKVGSCVASELTIKMLEPDRKIPKASQVILYVRFASEINGIIEYTDFIPQGAYRIDTRELNKTIDDLHTIEFHCYDRIMEMDQQYEQEGNVDNYPKTMEYVVYEVCNRLGLYLDGRNLPEHWGEYLIEYPGYGEGAYTIREIMEYIAAACCGNWVINYAGNLAFIPFESKNIETSYILSHKETPITFGGTRIIIKGNRIPPDYQEVEWICNSTGREYITTNYSVSRGKKFKIEAEYKPNNITDRACIISNYSTSTANNSFSLEMASGGYHRFWIDVSHDIRVQGITSNDYNRCGIEYNGYKDYNVYTEEDSSITVSQIIIDTYPLLIFTDKEKRFSTFSNRIKLKSLKIYDKNVAIHDYVPCYRKSDGAIGLYDAYENVFYENEGSGVFTKGDEIW